MGKSKFKIFNLIVFFIFILIASIYLWEFSHHDHSTNKIIQKQSLNKIIHYDGYLLAPSPDGKYFEVYYSNDKLDTIKVISTNTNKVLATISIKTTLKSLFAKIIWNKQSTKFIVTNTQVAYAFSVHSNQFNKLKDSFYEYKFTSDGNTVIGYNTGADTVTLYDLSRDKLVQKYKLPSDTEISQFFLMASNQIFIESIDSCFILQEGKIINLNLNFQTYSISKVNDHQITYIGLDNKTHLYDILTRKKKEIFDKPLITQWNSNSTYTIVTSQYEDFKPNNIYDTLTWKPVYKISEHQNGSYLWIDNERVLDVYSTMIVQDYYIELNNVKEKSTMTKKINKFVYTYYAETAKELFVQFEDGTVGIYYFPQ